MLAASRGTCGRQGPEQGRERPGGHAGSQCLCLEGTAQHVFHSRSPGRRSPVAPSQRQGSLGEGRSPWNIWRVPTVSDTLLDGMSGHHASSEPRAPSRRPPPNTARGLICVSVDIQRPHLSSVPTPPPPRSIQLLRNIWEPCFPVGDTELATDGVSPILGHPWYD